MYCPKCNTCYLDDGKFCQDCGAPLVQNSIYKEKKAYPAKIILAILALSLALAAGYALFKESAKEPVQPSKLPDAAISGSALRFTAGNSASPGTSVKRHARHGARNIPPGNVGDAPGAAGAAPGAAPAVPAAEAASAGNACAGKAPQGVGTPRAADTAAQGSWGKGHSRVPSAVHRDAPSQKPVYRQQQMVVIRDPLSAETRN